MVCPTFLLCVYENTQRNHIHCYDCHQFFSWNCLKFNRNGFVLHTYTSQFRRISLNCRTFSLHYNYKSWLDFMFRIIAFIQLSQCFSLKYCHHCRLVDRMFGGKRETNKGLKLQIGFISNTHSHIRPLDCSLSFHFFFSSSFPCHCWCLIFLFVYRKFAQFSTHLSIISTYSATLFILLLLLLLNPRCYRSQNRLHTFQNLFLFDSKQLPLFSIHCATATLLLLPLECFKSLTL